MWSPCLRLWSRLPPLIAAWCTSGPAGAAEDSAKACHRQQSLIHLKINQRRLVSQTYLELALFEPLYVERPLAARPGGGGSGGGLICFFFVWCSPKKLEYVSFLFLSPPMQFVASSSSARASVQHVPWSSILAARRLHTCAAASSQLVIRSAISQVSVHKHTMGSTSMFQKSEHGKAMRH